MNRSILTVWVCVGSILSLAGRVQSGEDFGACCDNLSGACFDSVEDSSCQANGGTFVGAGSTCAGAENTTCPVGACCSGGSCSERSGDAIETQRSCEGRDGTYLGDGVTCAAANTSCVGACCDSGSGGCFDSFEEVTCTNVGGTFLGLDSTCAGADNTTCPIGGCCVSGTCIEQDGGAFLTRTYCEGGGGTYLGDGVTCVEANTSCVGACCDSGSGACFNSFTESDCTDKGGGTFLGLDTRCEGPENTMCPIGACCVSGTCVEQDNGAFLTQTFCEGGGGTYLGDGVTCVEANTSCVGACCDSGSGACFNSFTESDCTDKGGGTFLGLDTRCEGPENSMCPIGACCVSGTCVEQDNGAFLTQTYCEGVRGTYFGDGTMCADGNTSCLGACCGECDCSVVMISECNSAGGTFFGPGTDCTCVVCDTTAPTLTCPAPITLPSGSRRCDNRVDGWESSFTASDNCPGPLVITSDLAMCGAPDGQTTGVTWEATDAAGNMASCTSEITILPSRLSSSQKGSLLTFSKVEIKWNADGTALLQDTFLSLANDYPNGVAIQAYFINGDISREEVRDNAGRIIENFEPGWNTADCLFTLTGNQPHAWSAARGSDKCQPFTVLDDDGPGRPDPETNGQSRILRGYVVMWAVGFSDFNNLWQEIQWNHLQGSGVLVNYALGTAWEYNAWAAQARCGVNGNAVADCVDRDANGTCCLSEIIPGRLELDGFAYDIAFDTLHFDFYGSGGTALSGGGRTLNLDTDLTLHPVTLDLRQDGMGPVLTKVEADVWNENESKFSGARRCICCWDQTLVSAWSQSAAIPNYFMRTVLGTDKGKARLRAGASIECDYSQRCGIDPPQVIVYEFGPMADAILGLAAKFISFTGGGPTAHDAAGMNLAGSGRTRALIQTDIMSGGDELRNPIGVLHKRPMPTRTNTDKSSASDQASPR